MQIGVFAKTFAGSDPMTVLMASRKAGFDCVQYNMACSGLDALPNEIQAEEAMQVSNAAQATGTTIAAISATYNMTDPDSGRRRAGRHAFNAIAAHASIMGSRILTVCSGSMDANDKWRRHSMNDDPASWNDMCREFEIICTIADTHNLMIGVEPEPANIVSSVPRAADLLSQFPGSPIRIILDPANLIEGIAPDRHECIIDTAFERLGTMIVMAHAKDRFADGSVAPAGEGVVDWSHFLGGLAACGFDGPLIAHGLTANAAPAVANFLAAQVGRKG